MTIMKTSKKKRRKRKKKKLIRKISSLTMTLIMAEKSEKPSETLNDFE